MDVWHELTEIARCNGGLITRGQADSAGVAHQRIAEFVHDGLLARIAHGVYTVGPSNGPASDPRTVCAHRLVLSHLSAAAWHEIDLPCPPDALHATAPRNRGRRKDAIRGVVLHRATLAPDDIVVVRGIPVSSPLRTAIDVSRQLDLAYAVATVDSFLRARHFRVEEFVLAASRWRGPGGVRLRLVAELVDPKSGSILESLARVLMWRDGIAIPETQYWYTHPRLGTIGRFDFAWPASRAIVECDGYEFHARRGPFQKDRQRWTAVGTGGWHLAVFTWFDVTCEPEYVVAAVRDLLMLD